MVSWHRCLAGIILLSFVTVICLALAAPARACSPSPRFTPVHLVEQSKQIALVRFGKPKGGAVPLTVLNRLKGKLAMQRATLKLAAAPKEHVAAFRAVLAKNGAAPAALFLSDARKEFDDDDAPPDMILGDDTPGPAHIVHALLHCRGQWLRMSYDTKKAELAFERIDSRLHGVWYGGTDMLIRCVKYVLEADDPVVPIATGTAWSEPEKITRLQGRVRGLRLVDLTGKGAPVLFVAAERGDQLWQHSRKNQRDEFLEITRPSTLRSRSRHAAWADFNGDGRLDLASWDGRRLTFHLQSKEGTFDREAPAIGALQDVRGLSVVGLSGPTAGLLAATPAGPVVVERRRNGVVTVQRLAVKIKRDLGNAGSCLVADLDGDSYADVLHLFRKGSALYRGKAGGGFRPGVPCPVKLAGKSGHATLGDYDGDGRLDVFTAGDDEVQVWQNLGGGAFQPVLQWSGEVAYMLAPAPGVRAATCDFNNDGRQDLATFHPNRAPMLFYNRGFRALAYAHQVDLAEMNLIPAVQKGTQAGLVADLDADGAQDMIVAAKNGELWVCWNDLPGAYDVNAVRAVLPLRGRTPGPITVTSREGKHPRGAWALRAGRSGLLLGMAEPGPLTVAWRFPGEPERAKTLLVEDSVVRFAIPSAATDPKN